MPLKWRRRLWCRFGRTCVSCILIRRGLALTVSHVRDLRRDFPIKVFWERVFPFCVFHDTMAARIRS